MKTTIYWSILLCAALYSCAPQRMAFNVEKMQCTAFEPLQLQPMEDLLQLRIDLIRQTTTERVNDSLSETQNVPYHTLGFYLGNGLYYDLHHNLSFRIDLLLAVSPPAPFQIEKTVLRPNLNISEWCRHQDGVYTRELSSRKRGPVYLFHTRQAADSLYVFRRERLYFFIRKADTLLTYGNARSALVEIRQTDKGIYRQIRPRSRAAFELHDNALILADQYKITRSDDGCELLITRMRRRKDVLLYNIKRDAQRIVVYNNRRYEMLLENRDGKWEVSISGRPRIAFSRLY